MKTKDLIKQLQEADPTGETHVCVEGIDIHFIDVLPAYYDGPFQVLLRDETTKYYNIIGGKFFRNTGNKVLIKTLSFEDAIWNNTDFQIDYSDLDERRQKEYKERYEKNRQEVIDVENKIEIEYLAEWAKSKLPETITKSKILNVAEEFYKKHLSRKDPINCGSLSYVEARKRQWDNKLNVTFDNEDFDIILKKVDKYNE